MLEENANVTHIEKDKEQDTYYMSSKKVLTKSQKLVALSLAFFAFLTVVFWSQQFKKNIANPFFHNSRLTAHNEENNNAACQDGNCSASPQEASRTKDTDGDGLWDWDEENLFGTSIYLEDTDSDGISDKNEIDNGDDPNCPAGQNCSGEAQIQPQGGTDASVDSELSEADVANFLEQLEAAQTETQAGGEDKVMQDLLDGKASAETLRAMLESAGMEQAVLDNLSDDELLEVYEGMIK